MKKYSEEAFTVRQNKVNELREMYVKSNAATDKIAYHISRLYSFMPKTKKDMYIVNLHIDRLLVKEYVETLKPEYQEKWIKICESMRG